MAQRLCIFIPSYNAGGFLASTVDRLPLAALRAAWIVDVLFVDNASTDDTPAIIGQLRASLDSAGVGVHTELRDTNRGYGGSVKTAIGFALARDYDVLAVVHADGQYAPEELPRLLSELAAEPRTALHFGSRLTGDPLRGGMPLYKFVANHALSRLQNLCSGMNLSEYHSGYRLYRVKYLAPLAWTRLSSGFVVDIEILFMLHAAGLQISESPIPTHYGSEKSHVPRLGTPIAILRNLGRYVMSRAGRRDPLYRPT
jgi:glycosyltransferase involved in cell wall biosynthesis